MRSLFQPAVLGQLKYFDVPLGAFPVPWNLECQPGETRGPDGICKPRGLGIRMGQGGHPSAWTFEELDLWARQALVDPDRPDCAALMPDRVAEDLGFKAGLAASGATMTEPADLSPEEIEFIQDVQLCRAKPAPEKKEEGIPMAAWIAIGSAAAIGLVVALT